MDISLLYLHLAVNFSSLFNRIVDTAFVKYHKMHMYSIHAKDHALFKLKEEKQNRCRYRILVFYFINLNFAISL